MSWLKLKSSILPSRGESSREHLDDVRSKLNVNEEYVKALRTKSYMEIWDKVHGDEKITTALLDSSLSLPRTTNSTTTNISEYLLEPRQDTLSDMFKTSDLHHLLIDFFDSNIEACRICGLLLRSIERTRLNYNVIQKIIKLSTKTPDSSSYTDDQCRVIFNNLASFAKLENPLSSSNLLQLDKLRNQCRSILDQLTTTHRSIGRRVKFIGLCEKIWGLFLIVACGALAAAALVLGVHSLIGIVAATPILVCINLNTLMSFLKWIKIKCYSSRRSGGLMNLKRIGAQLDAAAKGVFILDQDFGTMSRLAMRLHDEIEHIKSIAGLCLRNQKRQMLKEVVKEMRTHKSCFLEQLDELEEHVHLCFLTINRARRLVIQQILVHRSHQLS